jgi:hypothetical protein
VMAPPTVASSTIVLSVRRVRAVFEVVEAFDRAVDVDVVEAVDAVEEVTTTMRAEISMEERRRAKVKLRLKSDVSRHRNDSDDVQPAINCP